jgi:hypothetical protein
LDAFKLHGAYKQIHGRGTGSPETADSHNETTIERFAELFNFSRQKLMPGPPRRPIMGLGASANW